MLALFAAILMLCGCATGGRERPGTVAGTSSTDQLPLPAPAGIAEAPLPQPQQNAVALLVPMRGTNAPVGQSIANAASMALLDVGNQMVRLTVYDTTEGPEVAANRALADGARLFVGPLLAPDVRAVKAIAQGAGVPILTFSNDASLAGTGTYVLGFQPDQSISRVVGYARARGARRFGALFPTGVYGQRASAAFMEAVQGTGGQVAAVETFPRDPKKLTASVRRLTDYQARVARARQEGLLRPDGTIAPVEGRLDPISFEALLIADNAKISAAFQPLLARYGARPATGQLQLLGPELWSNEPGLSQVPAMRGAWFASVPDGRFRQLARRYRDRFGSEPSRLASLGYDAMLLVNSLAGSWTLGDRFPVERLTNPSGFVGIDGIFRFAASGVAERGFEVQEVTPSGFVTVSPAPASFTQPVHKPLN
jgi:branched-chain amino acid transport system substrate-binding protein